MDPAYGRGKRESVTTRTAVEYFCTLSQTPGGQCLGNLFVLSGEYNGKVCCACMQTDKVLGWSAPPGGPLSGALRRVCPLGLAARPRGRCRCAGLVRATKPGRDPVARTLNLRLSPRREMTQSACVQTRPHNTRRLGTPGCGEREHGGRVWSQRPGPPAGDTDWMKNVKTAPRNGRFRLTSGAVTAAPRRDSPTLEPDPRASRPGLVLVSRSP